MKLESNWLVSSQTVANIQRFFGLERDPPNEIDTNNKPSTSNGHAVSTHNGVHHRQQEQACPQSNKNGNPASTSASTKDEQKYSVKKWFWYWLFAFGATLGDDVFYYTFYPFWFYNLSPWVIRRVILMWGLCMYVGQSSKEILRWPRPSDPPAVRIEKRYLKEYGMPSTHAMVGTLVPFTILAVTWDHYEYSHTWGIVLASSYTLLVCFSRLYRGMHYILDILVGTGVCIILMTIYLQFIDALDYFLVTHPYAPIPLIAVSFLLCLIYPCKEDNGWSSTRNDTTMCLACVSGIMTACWLCNRLGWLLDADVPVSHPIEFPGWTSIALMLLRELIGCCIMVIVHVTMRALVLSALSVVMWKKIDRSKETSVHIELPYKFIAYFCICCAMILVSPVTFKALGIPIYTFKL